MSNHNKPLLLLVDDNEISLHALERVFHGQDYELATASNGVEALELASKLRPDLILLDVVMPEIDGFEVCRRIRQTEAIAEVPIVLLTSLTDSEARLEGFRAGADDFVSKPVDRLELRTRVRSITRLNRYRRLLEQREELEAVRMEERFRKLIEGATDIIATIDAQHRYQYVSPTSTMLGFEPGELRGRSILDGVHPEDHPKIEKGFEKALEIPGESVEIQFRQRHGDGSWRHLEARLRNALTDEDIRAFVFNARDVTERQELWDQFIQSQKMEIVGQLAAGVAHDFNNILVLIHNYAHFALAQVPPNSQAANDIRAIDEAGRRGEATIRKLLAFTRKGAHQQPTTLDLGDAMTTMKGLFQPLLGAGIDWHVDVAADLPPVKMDPVHFEQIMLNLLVNARDAMTEGGRLEVTMTSVNESEKKVLPNDVSLEPGPYVRIVVEDEGPGMSPEVQSRIFDAFFTTKAVGKGTGLGLSTVRTLTKQAGGEIFVDSRIGRGTRFEIWIPASQRDIVADAREPAPEQARQGRRVLIVDDDESILHVLERIVIGMGLEVETTSRAETAVEICTDSDIDLLIVDILLGDANGVELVKRIREHRPDLPYLYMSGLSGAEAQANGSAIAKKNFLAKPFSIRDFEKKIWNLIR